MDLKERNYEKKECPRPKENWGLSLTHPEGTLEMKHTISAADIPLKWTAYVETPTRGRMQLQKIKLKRQQFTYPSKLVHHPSQDMNADRSLYFSWRNILLHMVCPKVSLRITNIASTTITQQFRV